MLDLIPWLAAVLVAFTSIGVLLSRDWRLSLALFAIQYFGMFWLVMVHWPLTLSATRLVTGWMAVAVLGITLTDLKTNLETETAWPAGRLFRLFAGGMVLITVSQATPAVAEWLPAGGIPVLWSGLMLIGAGLLHLGITAQPLRVIFGLLTTLSGFEILFSVVENSILVAGLLSLITLGLALVGSYLLGASVAEETA
jgi:hypothetical protein